MPKYNGQIIVLFNPDSTVLSGTKALLTKAKAKKLPTEMVMVTSPSGKATIGEELSLKVAAARLKGPLRIYLRGHGDWASQKLGHWAPAHVAAYLLSAQLPEVKTVSVTGCRLGLEYGKPTGVGIEHSCQTFGMALSAKLLPKWKNTEVHARTYFVGVETRQSHGIGKKGTWESVEDVDGVIRGVGSMDHKRAKSKVTYYRDVSWPGNVALRYAYDEDWEEEDLVA